jgi:hypothetical protein
VDGIRRALEWAGLNYDFGWFPTSWRCKKENRICTSRSRELKERSPRPIFSSEFPLNPSCGRIIFIPGSQNVWICISNMLQSYLQCVVLKVVVSWFLSHDSRLAMPTDASVLRMCSQRHVKNWPEQVPVRHTTDDACI